jgi:peptide/nickel transport system permease protein
MAVSQADEGSLRAVLTAEAAAPAVVEPGVGTGTPVRTGAGQPARWGTLRRLARNRKAMTGLLILLVFVLAAVLAPVLAPGDPTDFVARPHLAPSRDHWLGTTGSGQDVLDQTIWGARPTLAVGFIVGALTTIVGAAVGMVAGYFRGWVDDVLSLVMNVFLIIPALPLLVVLAAFLEGGGMKGIVFVLTFTGWAWPARVLRSQMLSLREKEFVAAARVTGEHSLRIIFSEILPNMLSIVAATMVGGVIYAIGAEAALEFIGLGNPSVVSWGTNLYWAQNNAGLLVGAWWTFVPAGLCIALVAFALALVNNAIDEITNPRLRAQKVRSRVLRRVSVRGGRATPVLRSLA